MANAYQSEGDVPNLISSYLDFAVLNNGQVQLVYNQLQRFISDEKNMEALQKELYGRIQNNQNELVYIEMLMWALKQQKDFAGALVQ